MALDREKLNGTGCSDEHVPSVLDAIDANTAAVAVAVANDIVHAASQLLHATLEINIALMTAAAVTQSFDVVTPSATQKAYIVDAWLDLEEVVAGGSIATATLQVGQDEGPDTDAYILAEDVFTGATIEAKVDYTQKGADLVTVNTADFGRNTALLAATKKITALLTTTTDDIDQATTGIIHVHVLYRLLPL